MKLPPRRLVPALIVMLILIGQGVAGLVTVVKELPPLHRRLGEASELVTGQQRIEAMLGTRKGLYTALDGLLADDAVVIYVPRPSGEQPFKVLYHVLWPRRVLDLPMATALLERSEADTPTFVLDLEPTGSEEPWHRLGPRILATEGAELWQVERR